MSDLAYPWPDDERPAATIPRFERSELLDALREAEAGLVFAGADITVPDGDFVPSPTLALRRVRAVLARYPRVHR